MFTEWCLMHASAALKAMITILKRDWKPTVNQCNDLRIRIIPAWQGCSVRSLAAYVCTICSFEVTFGSNPT